MENADTRNNRRCFFVPYKGKMSALMQISICSLIILSILFLGAKLLYQPDRTSDVTLKAKQVEYPKNTAQISLLIMNHSEYPITYYDAYSIECKRDNKWEKTEMSYSPFFSRTQPTKELEPGCELEMLITTAFPYGYLPTGEYRVMLALKHGRDSLPLYAEFAIVDTTIRL